MAMNLELIAAIVSVILGLIAPLPYIKNIFWGETRPHIFSWFIWTVTICAGFYGQIIGGAGLGATALGVTVVMNIVVLIAALIKSRDYISKFDVIIFVMTGLAMIPWVFAEDAITSIILLAIIDFGGFLPTLRKSIKNPETESLSLYIISAAKHVFSLFALSAYNILTLTFPLMLIALNISIVAVLYLKRRR